MEVVGAFLKQAQKLRAFLVMFSGVGDKVANLTHRVDTHGFPNLAILSGLAVTAVSILCGRMPSNATLKVNQKAVIASES